MRFFRFKPALGGLLILFQLFSHLSCSYNILENFSDKKSNQALLTEAKDLINRGAFQQALNKLNSITGSLAQDRSVVALKASAHAGLCGLRFFPFVDALQNMGSTRLFPFLLNHFVAGTPARIDACIAAEDLVESIGPSANRTSDENLLLVLISFAKIGNILSLYSDADQDGVADTGYDACPNGVSRVAGPLYDPDVNELGTAINLALENIASVGNTVDIGDSALNDINNVCTTLAGIDPNLDFCGVTDPTAITAFHRSALRSLVKEDAIVGLGTNCTGDITTCNCP